VLNDWTGSEWLVGTNVEGSRSGLSEGTTTQCAWVELWKITSKLGRGYDLSRAHFNPLALELDIYSLAHHLCKV